MRFKIDVNDQAFKNRLFSHVVRGTLLLELLRYAVQLQTLVLAWVCICLCSSKIGEVQVERVQVRCRDHSDCLMLVLCQYWLGQCLSPREREFSWVTRFRSTSALPQSILLNKSTFLQYLLVAHYTLAFHAHLDALVKATCRAVATAALFNLAPFVIGTGKLLWAFDCASKEALKYRVSVSTLKLLKWPSDLITMEL